MLTVVGQPADTVASILQITCIVGYHIAAEDARMQPLCPPFYNIHRHRNQLWLTLVHFVSVISHIKSWRTSCLLQKISKLFYKLLLELERMVVTMILIMVICTVNFEVYAVNSSFSLLWNDCNYCNHNTADNKWMTFDVIPSSNTNPKPLFSRKVIPMQTNQLLKSGQSHFKLRSSCHHHLQCHA